jgi:hypothetical protein
VETLLQNLLRYGEGIPRVTSRELSYAVRRRGFKEKVVTLHPSDAFAERHPFARAVATPTAGSRHPLWLAAVARFKMCPPRCEQRAQQGKESRRGLGCRLVLGLGGCCIA